MAHNLPRAEIWHMYNLLYKYEHSLKNVNDKSQIVIVDLFRFLTTNDIYTNTLNRSNENEARVHRGYFLYRQANSNDKSYRLIYHLRNAFAHGFVELNKRTKRISFKDGERKIKGEIPKELLIPLLTILQTARN